VQQPCLKNATLFGFGIDFEKTLCILRMLGKKYERSLFSEYPKTWMNQKGLKINLIETMFVVYSVKLVI
jgi:hypothetical protein